MSPSGMPGIEEYIATFPAEARGVVGALYGIGRRLAPDAEEGVSYAVPCLMVGGKGVIGVSASARHLSLVPFSSTAIEAARDALEGVATTRGTLRFTVDAPLPEAAVEAVVRARLRELGSR